jgi:hypothetical protein
MVQLKEWQADLKSQIKKLQSYTAPQFSPLRILYNVISLTLYFLASCL